jgi:hypothetical protein
MWTTLSVLAAARAGGLGVSDDVLAAGAASLLGEVVGLGLTAGALSDDHYPLTIPVGGGALGGVAGGALVALARRTGTEKTTALYALAPAVAGTLAVGLGEALQGGLAPNAPEAAYGAYGVGAVLIVAGIPAGAAIGIQAGNTGSGSGRAPWMVTARPGGVGLAGTF